MLYTLTKLSSPGWEFTTTHQHLVLDQLEPFICSTCIQDLGNGLNLLPADSQLFELLSTSCGAEFYYTAEEQIEPN